jgi:hypothetical protein
MSDKRRWWLLVPLVVVLVPVVVVGLAVVGFALWGAIVIAGIESKEPAVTPPLSSMRVSLHYGKVDEVYIRLAPGTKLQDALNLDVFDGFDPHMTLDDARARLGLPSGEQEDEFCRKTTAYYARPTGRVSLCRYPTEGGHRWDIVAVPMPATHAAVFRDQRIPQQLRAWLREDRPVSVHVLRQIGWGGATIGMTSTRCAWVMLSEREEAVVPPKDALAALANESIGSGPAKR